MTYQSGVTGENIHVDSSSTQLNNIIQQLCSRYYICEQSFFFIIIGLMENYLIFHLTDFYAKIASKAVVSTFEAIVSYIIKRHPQN